MKQLFVFFAFATVISLASAQTDNDIYSDFSLHLLNSGTSEPGGVAINSTGDYLSVFTATGGALVQAKYNINAGGSSSDLHSFYRPGNVESRATYARAVNVDGVSCGKGLDQGNKVLAAIWWTYSTNPKDASPANNASDSAELFSLDASTTVRAVGECVKHSDGFVHPLYATYDGTTVTSEIVDLDSLHGQTCNWATMRAILNDPSQTDDVWAVGYGSFAVYGILPLLWHKHTTGAFTVAEVPYWSYGTTQGKATGVSPDGSITGFSLTSGGANDYMFTTKAAGEVTLMKDQNNATTPSQIIGSSTCTAVGNSGRPFTWTGAVPSALGLFRDFRGVLDPTLVSYNESGVTLSAVTSKTFSDYTGVLCLVQKSNGAVYLAVNDKNNVTMSANPSVTGGTITDGSYTDLKTYDAAYMTFQRDGNPAADATYAIGVTCTGNISTDPSGFWFRATLIGFDTGVNYIVKAQVWDYTLNGGAGGWDASLYTLGSFTLANDTTVDVHVTSAGNYINGSHQVKARLLVGYGFSAQSPPVYWKFKVDQVKWWKS